jgi:pyruvate/2-oxoglutarate dehydrogenase complex dihydrolipoamide acyltransferase (E2) component
MRHIKNGKLTPAKREQIMNLKNESKISGNQEMAKLPKSKTTTKPKKYVDIPLTNMRQVIAKRLSQSKVKILNIF